MKTTLKFPRFQLPSLRVRFRKVHYVFILPALGVLWYLNLRSPVPAKFDIPWISAVLTQAQAEMKQASSRMQTLAAQQAKELAEKSDAEIQQEFQAVERDCSKLKTFNFHTYIQVRVLIKTPGTTLEQVESMLGPGCPLARDRFFWIAETGRLLELTFKDRELDPSQTKYSFPASVGNPGEGHHHHE